MESIIDMNHPDYEKLRADYRSALAYIRQKTNQLLEVMGTMPLICDEVDDKTVIELDPIGIVAEAFAQILENLRNTNRDLKSSYEEIEALFNSIPAGVAIIDADSLEILDVNPTGAKLIGLTHAEIVGNRCCSFFCPHLDYECPAKIINTDIDKAERILRTASGEQLIVLKSVRKGRFKGRNIFIESFIDITENKKLQEEVIRHQRIEYLSVLAGGIAHDFNNVLTAILGNITIAMQSLKETNNNAYERLRRAERAAQRAQGLARQLLTFSKGGAPILKTSSIKDLLIDTVNFTLTGKNVKVEFSIEPDLPFTNIDEGQMSQVFQNLTLNAVEAMSKGGVLYVSMALEPLKGGKFINISFRDSGSGLDERTKERLFEPFFTTKQQGSGLGLCIVASIVKKHGGHVIADNHPEGGAVFSVLLPVEETKGEVSQATNEEPKEQANERSQGRILIMDDDQMVIEVVEEMLNILGYDTVAVNNGNEAIDAYRDAMAENRGFDLVIMDMTIPGGMGGIDAITKLLEVDPKVKALMSSGYNISDSVESYKNYGFVGIITKPFKFKELKTSIEQALSC